MVPSTITWLGSSIPYFFAISLLIIKVHDVFPVKNVVVTSLSILLLLSVDIIESKNIRNIKCSFYMKSLKSKGTNESSYIPHDKLVNFLEARLRLLKEHRKPKEKNEGLASKDSKLKGKPKKPKGRMRNYYLNKYVFPSMANVITFFEFIRNNPELQEDFEDELEELLMSWNKNDKSKTPAFARLVNGATSWDYKKDRFNFRLSLLYAMQEAIRLKLPSFAKHDFHKHAGKFGWTISEKMVGEDMERAISWAGFFAGTALNPETQKEWDDYDRPLLF